MRDSADSSPTGNPEASLLRNLYLLRHGPAEDAFGTTDAERALTPWGEELMRRAGAVLGQRGVRPRLILSSPYRRARETAEVLLELLLPPEGVRIDDRLASGATPDGVLDLARQVLSAGDALLVGHNPEMEGAVRKLARAGECRPGPMRPGTLAWFVCGPENLRNARLEAFLPAEDLLA